jgi:regulator of protease activity HflC (stomatin/prohibitin superfamily)
MASPQIPPPPTSIRRRSYPEEDSFFSPRLFVFIVVYLLFEASSLLLGSQTYGKTTINWSVIFSAICLAHFLVSIDLIGEQEIGALKFLGRLQLNLNSGPHFVPFLLYSVRIIPKNSVQFEFGTMSDPESLKQVERSQTSNLLWMDPEPIRITWTDINTLRLDDSVKRLYAQSLFSREITTDPRFLCSYKVSDACRFIEVVGDIQEANRRIKAVCVSTLSEEAGATFLARAQNQLVQLNDRLLHRVEELVGDPNSPPNPRYEPWGVDIQTVSLISFGTPKRTNEGMAERSKEIAVSQGTKQATITVSEGESQKNINLSVAKRQETINLSEGEATAIVNKARAAADAIRSRSAAIHDSTHGELLLKLDAVIASLTTGQGKTVIVPGDMSFIKDAMAIAESIRSSNP